MDKSWSEIQDLDLITLFVRYSAEIFDRAEIYRAGWKCKLLRKGRANSIEDIRDLPFK